MYLKIMKNSSVKILAIRGKFNEGLLATSRSG